MYIINKLTIFREIASNTSPLYCVTWYNIYEYL